MNSDTPLSDYQDCLRMADLQSITLDRLYH